MPQEVFYGVSSAARIRQRGSAVFFCRVQFWWSADDQSAISVSNAGDACPSEIQESSLMSTWQDPVLQGCCLVARRPAPQHLYSICHCVYTSCNSKNRDVGLAHMGPVSSPLQPPFIASTSPSLPTIRSVASRAPSQRRPQWHSSLSHRCRSHGGLGPHRRNRLARLTRRSRLE